MRERIRHAAPLRIRCRPRNLVAGDYNSRIPRHRRGTSAFISPPRDSLYTRDDDDEIFLSCRGRASRPG